jgi:putative RNA 2'-phosphotransferase
MENKVKDKISKLLSLVLRHKPEELGIVLDKEGWALTGAILEKMNISLEDLKEVVKSNDKQRFVFSADLSKIRANQGHSIDVD